MLLPVLTRTTRWYGRIQFLTEVNHNKAEQGTSTVGSSEAIMLATLAMKRRWQNKRKAAGKDISKPNIVMNSAVQVCWEKAARYFEIEEKYVFCTKDRYVIDPAEAVAMIGMKLLLLCLHRLRRPQMRTQSASALFLEALTPVNTKIRRPLMTCSSRKALIARSMSTLLVEDLLRHLSCQKWSGISV